MVDHLYNIPFVKKVEIMQKIIVVLSIIIFVSVIVIALQFIRIQRLEQRLTYTIGFISIKGSDLINSMINDGEISENDMNIIINNLRQHKRLIPIQGVLGGTMDYRAFKWIHKIDQNSGYIIARAEDGHIGVDMFLYYARANDGSIKWELIAYKSINGVPADWIPNRR
jgi:hypothetical protein